MENKDFFDDIKKALLMGYRLGRQDESEGVFIDEDTLISFYLEQASKVVVNM